MPSRCLPLCRRKQHRMWCNGMSLWALPFDLDKDLLLDAEYRQYSPEAKKHLKGDGDTRWIHRGADDIAVSRQIAPPALRIVSSSPMI
ncbi:hypothetical protein D3C72_2125040 [compost metagenome]